MPQIEPTTKTCASCQAVFPIPEEDLTFYERISPTFNGKKYLIPTPTLCPVCRKQRRYAWRNIHTYYNSTCQKCQKPTISAFHPDSPFNVYCTRCWWQNDWDGKEYGQPYDFSRPFFEQFHELHTKVPEIAMINDNGVASTNCEYTYNFCYSKNCYLCTTAWHCEDCIYYNNGAYSKNVVDADITIHSEIAYFCSGSEKLYNCSFLKDSSNCTDCSFGIDLKGCTDCFGCVGLRQKKYHIFNKPYSKEEYKEKMAGYNLGNYDELEKVKKQFQEFAQKLPVRGTILTNCEDSRGDRLFDCRNVEGFNIWYGENCRYYAGSADTPKNSYDITIGGKHEWCYESIVPDFSYMTCFTNYCWKCSNVYYGINCHSSQNLFGCIGLKNQKYCILNKQYTQKEYEELVPKIVDHMKKTGEWGEFFPGSISPFSYNETVALDKIPLSRKQAEEKGFSWQNDLPFTTGKETIAWKNVPKDIQDVKESLCNEVLACQNCQRNYKILPQELKFYKKHSFPIPRECPTCRRLERIKDVNTIQLFETQCANCQQKIPSRYKDNTNKTVYCEDCYLKFTYANTQ